MSGGLRLRRGPGAGTRLVTAGLPDGLACEPDGAVWWWGPAGAFRWSGDPSDEEIRWWPVGAVSDAAWVSEGLLAVIEGENCAELALLGEGPTVQGRLEGVAVEQVRPGRGQVVIRQAGRSRVEPLDGAPPPLLPLGARAGRLAPWPSPRGLSWLDGGVLYRRAAGGPTRTAGTHPPKLAGMLVGPEGSAVLLTEDAARLVAPAGRPVAWPRPVEDAAFSPDGQRALLDDGEAVHLVVLATGALLHTWEGPHLAAGFRPAPTCLCLETGDLVDAAGRRTALGLRPWACAAAGDRVVGPEGAAWDLARGAPAWTHPMLDAESVAVGHDGVAAASEGVVVHLGLDGVERGRGMIPEGLCDPEDPGRLVDWHRGRLRWSTSEGAWATAPTGEALEALPEHLHPDEPLGGVVEAGGRTWTWTHTGLLLALDQPPARVT